VDCSLLTLAPCPIVQINFPEQTGGEKRPPNKYSAAVKANIRDHTLRSLWEMLQNPKLYRNAFPEDLKERVAAELRMS
jgi:hypothetical protein